MPRVCQWAPCGHPVHKTKNGQWPRFCNCQACHCRQLDKKEHLAELRKEREKALLEADRYWIEVRGRRVGVVTVKMAVAVANRLSKELDRERHKAKAGEDAAGALARSRQPDARLRAERPPRPPEILQQLLPAPDRQHARTDQRRSRHADRRVQKVARPAREPPRRPRDRQFANALGREGRRGNDEHKSTIVDARSLQVILEFRMRLGWTEDEYLRWLASRNSPLGGRTAIRTIGDARSVQWAMKKMLKAKGLWQPTRQQ
jgi:hypothetical protein